MNTTQIESRRKETNVYNYFGYAKFKQILRAKFLRTKYDNLDQNRSITEDNQGK